MADIQSMREALKNKPKDEIDEIREVLPDEIIVGVEGDPEEYVEKQGLCLSATLNRLAADETLTVAEYNDELAHHLSEMSDEDADQFREIISDEKGHALWFQEMALKYDEINPSQDTKQAVRSLEQSVEGTRR